MQEKKSQNTKNSLHTHYIAPKTSSMAEVSYICKRTVVSTKPVQPGKFYPLSVLDRTMEHNQLRLVYYYRSKIPRKAGEMTKILLECLSEMLTSYPVVTGRLVRDHEGHWMIKCNDAGVRMVEARAKGSMDEWLQNVDREKELKLIHWEEMYYKPYFWSTFYVQITEFEGGGLAIGLSCIHLLADPICATMLIKAWADLTLTGEMIAPPLFQPLPLRRPGDKDINHMPYTSLINHYKSSIHESIPVSNVKLATITLAFSDQMVEATIGMAQTGCSPDESSPSPFEALAGLFWFCISKVKGVTEGLMNMSISLDMRKVLGLDKGFFGNCMVYNKVHAKGFKEKGLLVEAIKAIKEVVAKMNGEGIMDLTEWLESNNVGDHHYYPSMNGCDLICSNLDGVDPYLASFEEGFAPIRCSYYVEPVFGEGQVLILPSPPGEGPLSRVVMVTLPEDEAVKLIEDNLIRHLISPTILMGVNKDNAA